MITRMKRFTRILLSVMVLASFLFPDSSLASSITIRPFLIDEVLTPRGEITQNITIKNEYAGRRAIMYATVNEISLDETGEIMEFVSPVMTDRTNTITSWIEVTRARIEVMSGETVEVPITIRTHPQAEPGEYHAFIGFVEAPNQPKAEAIAMAGDANGVVLKIVVSDERKDDMKIASFNVERFVTGEDSRSISVEVQNTGDITSVPTGEIIFYDSRGVEVSSVPINTDAAAVSPGNTITLTSEVPFNEKIGRFKANVSLKYGENQRASLFDTTYYYLMPLRLILLIFGGILIVAILIALLFRRVFMSHEVDEDFQDVTMYVRDGHSQEPKDHDIDLKNVS
jgi:hypothetical protein